MATSVGFERSDFTLDPDLPQGGFDGNAEVVNQLRDG
jgi:hypothetical protein